MPDLRPLLRTLVRHARVSLGLDARLATEDRRILENVILPEYARRSDVRRVLFVGCARYTSSYARQFADKHYATLDPRPAARRHGARRHIVAHLQDLGRHAAPGSFDLIVCNGVLGWGLDQPQDAERAFAACHTALRAGGELVVGWNDVRPRNRVVPDAVAALKRFRRVTFAPLGASRYRTPTDNAHTYDFFAR